MKKIPLGNNSQTGITIMVFAEGTILKPRSLFSHFNHNSYIPIGNAADIIKLWHIQGANIIYCTSRKEKQAEDMARLLKSFGFYGNYLTARERKEHYKDIVESVKPDVLVEDNCRSIGGAWQMCITRVSPEIKNNIVSVVVPEFVGIDNLPTNIYELMHVPPNREVIHK